MRKWISMAGVLVLAGCTSTGQMDPNLAARLNSDATCLGAMAQAGFDLAKMENKTPQTVLAQVKQASAVDPAIQAACVQLGANLAADIQAAKGAKKPAN